jgi:hypothetical protein
MIRDPFDDSTSRYSRVADRGENLRSRRHTRYNHNLRSPSTIQHNGSHHPLTDASTPTFNTIHHTLPHHLLTDGTLTLTRIANPVASNMTTCLFSVPTTRQLVAPSSSEFLLILSMHVMVVVCAGIFPSHASITAGRSAGSSTASRSCEWRVSSPLSCVSSIGLVVCTVSWNSSMHRFWNSSMHR